MRKVPRRFAVGLVSAALVVGGFGFRLSTAAGSGTTTNSPTGLRPSVGGWPEDVDGDGIVSDSGDERIPELISAVGDNGVEGYVRLEQLNGPSPSNPAEALAMSGQTRVIPLFASDGVTVVGQYTLRGTGAAVSATSG
jgi:hypothetical protein